MHKIMQKRTRAREFGFCLLLGKATTIEYNEAIESVGELCDACGTVSAAKIAKEPTGVV
jgi:hypothetical protein